MGVSKKVLHQIEAGSWIRRMFEEGAELKKQYGEENVIDLSLGNPDVPPPPQVLEAIQRIAEQNPDRIHVYMPNSGFPQVREVIARRLERELDLPFTADHVIMTVGAAGGLNVAIKGIIDPGDEVIVFAPFFPEYAFYVDNHGAILKLVEAKADFSIDLEALDAALTPRTKAIILNSPNNPTGRMLTAGELKGVAELLTAYRKNNDHPVYLLSDEPYRALLFDKKRFEAPAAYYPNTIIIYSYSKVFSLAGERIGYIAISPEAEDARSLFDAMTFVNRTLGFVNAPALMQRVVAAVDRYESPAPLYEKRRDIMYNGLVDAGYEVTKPDGAFYIFPRAPIEDDIEFVRYMQKKLVLVTPGTGFGRKGYFRISLCVPDEDLKKAIPKFKEAVQELKSKVV